MTRILIDQLRLTVVLLVVAAVAGVAAPAAAQDKPNIVIRVDDVG